MAIPRYKGIESIAKITSWFLKHDHKVTNKLWEHTEARNELNNWLICLFQNHQQSGINEKMNILFHEFTYLSLPQLEEWRQKNILNSEETEAYHNLLTLVDFQNAQLRIAGWIYQQLFKMEFSPFGNPFLILGYFDGFIDYYRVLDLPSTCTSEDIKKAYRAKAKTLHPDTGGDAEAFKQLKEAYDVLSDEQQRKIYDEKYELYQNWYDYDIKPSPMESRSTRNTKNKRIRFVVRFRWKAFIFATSGLILFSILFSFIGKLNGTTEQNQYIQPSVTEPAIEDSSNIEQITKEKFDESKNSTSSAVDTDSVFTFGSTKDEVKKVMGEPEEKEQFGNVSSWRYQDSSVEFDENEKVAGWSNFSHILKVSVGSKKEGALPFTKGSSIEEVANAMGTPDAVTQWGALWHYQNSIVEFDGETVIGWSDAAVSSEKEEYLQKLNNIEKGLVDLEYLYENDITSEMMEAESETYKRWDDTLNEIYGILIDQLSSDEMNKLKEEQRQWIANRDSTAEAESLEFKGGTMESLQYISTQVRLTKERCFELVQDYMQ
ncbi:hypothetical protein ASG65_11695 [Bacillus sp. Leaf13]|nr:hypothetical protein ASG65_11695 [Bacillus sp. Leaf13]